MSIKVGDLDFDRDLIILRVTKKYKQRLVPFGKDLAEILYHYCVRMGILNDPEAYLFPGEDTHSHISANNVGNYYRIIRKKAGIDWPLPDQEWTRCLPPLFQTYIRCQVL